MNRRQVLATLAGGLTTAGSGKPARAAGAAGLRLQRGINTWPWFSLTKEFPSPRTDYAWPPFQEQRPVPRPVDLKRLREIGFDFIRLPVDPGPFLFFTGERRERLLATLDEAVATALDAQLCVVVNIQANGATHHYEPQRLFSSILAPDYPAYRDLVAVIAGRLAAQDVSRVAIEPVNEPSQACGSDVWTDVQAGLLSAARASAPDLTYVATGACGSMISGLPGLSVRPFLDSGPTLFTVHFYEPYLFTHQGAPWMREPVYRALNAVPWPASEGTLEATLAAVRQRMAQDADTSNAAKESAYRETERVLAEYFAAEPARPFVEHYLGMVDRWREANGLASRDILIGEFGALRSDRRYVASGAADRARYVSDVRRTAEAFGFPWAFWNLFDGMGIMDDRTRTFDPAMLAALGLGDGH